MKDLIIVGTGVHAAEMAYMVERNSLIGTGAVVVKEVEEDSVMAGNPARRIRSRS